MIMPQTESHIEAGGAKAPSEIKVWDMAVRLFHWSLVLTFATAFLAAEEWDWLHETAGYVVGGLIAFRILWGLVGSKYARFGDFIYRPSMVLGYLRDSITGRAKRYFGHNPAGGAMVIALLASIAALAASGYAMTTNAYWGVEWVGELHEALAYGILGMVGLHVAGVLFASREHHENLIRAMITGYKSRLTQHR